MSTSPCDVLASCATPALDCAPTLALALLATPSRDPGPAPEQARARKKDKFSYRYPRGESYLDVIERVAPVIHALEQSTAPVLVIAHQGILRIIYAYFKNIPREEAPFLKIPLHQVIRLTPEAYECQEKVFPLMESEGVDAHAPSC